MHAEASCANFKQFALMILRNLFSRCIRGDEAAKQHFEVELKFKIDEAEAERLRDVLSRRGFRYTTTLSMSDTFLPSPVEGEILRIRQERNSEEHHRTIFTVKQWVKTRIGKTRKEAESDVPSTLAIIFLMVGRILNGKALLGFAKKRELFEGRLGAEQLLISIDEVFGLGDYSGWYLEAEVLVPLDRDPADYEQPILEEVQSLLGESRSPVKQSYRDMLLESYRLAGVA